MPWIQHISSLFRHLENFRGINLRIRFCSGFPPAIEKRKCHQPDKNDKTDNYFPSVIHSIHPPFPGVDRRADSVVRFFSPLQIKALATISWTPVTRTPGDPVIHQRQGAPPCRSHRCMPAYLPRISLCTCFTAFALGSPPLNLFSIFSDAFKPDPLPQQKVCSLIVLRRHFIEVITYTVYDISWLFQAVPCPSMYCMSHDRLQSDYRFCSDRD